MQKLVFCVFSTPHCWSDIVKETLDLYSQQMCYRCYETLLASYKQNSAQCNNVLSWKLRSWSNTAQNITARVANSILKKKRQ